MDTLARIRDLASKEFSLDAQALDPPAPLFKEAEAANLDRASQFALAAAAQAISSSALKLDGGADRIGVYWGTGLGGAHTLESAYKQVYGAGEWRVRPLTVVMAMNNA